MIFTQSIISPAMNKATGSFRLSPPSPPFLPLCHPPQPPLFSSLTPSSSVSATSPGIHLHPHLCISEHLGLLLPTSLLLPLPRDSHSLNTNDRDLQCPGSVQVCSPVRHHLPLPEGEELCGLGGGGSRLQGFGGGAVRRWGGARNWLLPSFLPLLLGTWMAL